MNNKIGFFRTEVFIPIDENGYCLKDDLENRISEIVIDEVNQMLKVERLKLASLIYFCNHGKFLEK